MLEWPPAYSVRRSQRARHASLRISPQRGLEIVLPLRYKLAEIPRLLNEKRNWIEKHHNILTQSLAESVEHELPQQIDLAAVAEYWKINYLASPSKNQIVLRPQYEITVVGDINDKPACLQVLQYWLRQKAEQVLPSRLLRLSQELNLPFKNLTIRNQKTRWGSCSADKLINLNAKLILLPPEIVRHIMIHELCHTVHLNHSRRFWQLVAHHDPHWQVHHRLSRRIETQLPRWIDS